MDDDIKRYIDSLFAVFEARNKELNQKLFSALNATNQALTAAIGELDTLKALVAELDHQEWRNDERITQLEVAKFRGEAPFLPAPEKMN